MIYADLWCALGHLERELEHAGLPSPTLNDMLDCLGHMEFILAERLVTAFNESGGPMEEDLPFPNY